MFTEVLSALRQYGWASFSGRLCEVAEFANTSGWEAVALRRGDQPLSSLRAVSSDRARTNSISAQTGLGAQPLHTDGAHLDTPPHLVALAADGKHRAATRLLVTGPDTAPWSDIQQGVFRVSDGRSRWHLTAGDNRTIRFDPCCMTPLDAPSRRVTRFFESAFDAALRFEWNSDTPTVLLIDNQRVLHAREAVDSADSPRLLMRIAFRCRQLTCDTA